MTLFLARAGKFGENENYFLENNEICMIWQELSNVNLSNVKTQEQLKEILLNTYQEQLKSVPNWASQIWIHLNKMKIGDLVILPLKNSRKIAIGKIISDYIFDPKKKPYSHIRKVEWIKKEIPRTSFDQDLLYSFGAFKTFCEINRNDAETRINAFISGKKNTTNNDTLKHQLENVNNEEVNLEETSLDQISKLILAKFKGKRLEALVESIFKAKGYFTYASPAGADGGVDILAAKGDLGFEKEESEKLYNEYSGIIGEPRIEITYDDYVTYELDLVDSTIEIYGHIDYYHTGRDEEHEFVPDDFGDERSEIYYDYNWEIVGKQIYDQFVENQYQKHKKK
jgi:restriction system protein